MNAVLVAGCAVAGALAGAALDVVAARVPAAPAPGTGDEAVAPAGPLHDDPALAITGAPATDPGVRAVPEPGAGPGAGPARPGSGPPGPLELVGTAVVTAVLFGAAAARFGPVPELAAYCVLFAGLVGISVADLRVGLVPRTLLYPTLGLMTVALVAAAAVAGDWTPLVHAAIGGAGAFAVFFGLWWFVPRGIGFGDVRLAGLIGAGLGWLGLADVYVGFLSGFVVGALMGTLKMLAQGTGRKTRFPFAPALAVGAVIGVLWGGSLASYWILHT
jgi:prepilin signal peptidase PulO-like enzyme (type II secretory pathway)